MTSDSLLLRLAMTLALALASGCDAEPAAATVALPYYDSAEFTPRWLAPDAVPADLHRVPAFSLTDQHGAAVTEADLDGQITVVNFFFTSCPGICPQLNRNMSIVGAAFPADTGVQLLSHSVTPEHDTVAVLASYAETRGITSSRWHLVTGPRDEIYALGRDAYFAEEDLGAPKGPDDFLHTESIILVDQQRHIRGIYNGLRQSAVEQLIADIQALLAETT